MTLILSNDDIDAVLTMSECIAVIEDAYVELSEGRAISRPRSDSLVPTSRPDALYGLKTMDGVAPKLGVGDPAQVPRSDQLVHTAQGPGTVVSSSRGRERRP